MPHPANQVNLGLEPKFPSASIFDDSAAHLMENMQYELWPAYVESKLYHSTLSRVASTLANTGKLPLLAIRTAQQKRYVSRIVKKVVTIGSGIDCDIVIKASTACSLLPVCPTPAAFMMQSKPAKCSGSGKATCILALDRSYRYQLVHRHPLGRLSRCPCNGGRLVSSCPLPRALHPMPCVVMRVRHHSLE